MPLQRRVPKRGFTNLFKKRFSVINVGDLGGFPEGSEIGPEILIAKGLVRNTHDGIKLLADGKIEHPLKISVHKASAAAVAKVEAIGGRVDLIPMPKRK